MIKQAHPVLKLPLWGLSIAILTACTSTTPQIAPVRTAQPVDGVPSGGTAKISLIPEPVPRHESRGKYGNHSPYQVRGKTYEVMKTGRGYTQEGIASWYGSKFDGKRTSSWELYSPYAMTAAHKSLPLPTYVRVTNLNNNKTVIVRVNDRGPFHEARIIDLSYAAAVKLGFVEKGTAKVRIETITPPIQAFDKVNLSGNITEQNRERKIYLQAGAFIKQDTALRLKQKLATVTQSPVSITYIDHPVPHRVRVGPFEDETSARKVQQIIRKTEIGEPLLIRP